VSTSRQSPEQPGGEERVVYVERAGNGTGRTATVRNPALRTWRVAALLAVLALSGCATTTTQNSPDSSSGGGGSKHRVARIGNAITLKGNTNTMRVRVLKVIDPLPAGQYDQPPAGKRYVGIELTMQNTGQATYNDSPSNGAHILTSTDEQADSTIVSGGPCSGGFASSSTIAAGDKRRGCIPFEVPKGARPRTFQFALDSGFGPQSGEWRLR